MLQSECPGRWQLKSPQYGLLLDELFATYPDARFVVTHRDPVKIVASTFSLVRSLTGTFTDVDHTEYIVHALARHLVGAARPGDGRARPHRRRRRSSTSPTPTSCAIPVAVVGAIYERFGIDWNADKEQYFRRFHADNPQHKYGTHTYSLAEVGVEPRSARRALRPLHRPLRRTQGGRCERPVRHDAVRRARAGRHGHARPPRRAQRVRRGHGARARRRVPALRRGRRHPRRRAHRDAAGVLLGRRPRTAWRDVRQGRHVHLQRRRPPVPAVGRAQAGDRCDQRTRHRRRHDAGDPVRSPLHGGRRQVRGRADAARCDGRCVRALVAAAHRGHGQRGRDPPHRPDVRRSRHAASRCRQSGASGRRGAARGVAVRAGDGGDHRADVGGLQQARARGRASTSTETRSTTSRRCCTTTSWAVPTPRRVCWRSWSDERRTGRGVWPTIGRPIGRERRRS